MSVIGDILLFIKMTSEVIVAVIGFFVICICIMGGKISYESKGLIGHIKKWKSEKEGTNNGK